MKDENVIENLKKYLLVTKENAIKQGIYEEFKYCLDEMAFLHLGISWMHMVSYDKSVKMQELLKDTTRYLDKEFPTWRKSKFFKLSHCFPKGIKFIGIWGVHLLYRMGLPIIYIWGYKFLVEKLHIVIKW